MRTKFPGNDHFPTVWEFSGGSLNLETGCETSGMLYNKKGAP